ncbi:MAG: Fis family transcriptional regulator [Acidobacteria bacterium]|nr:MAG: Fis family transcriptional regulator [Acidobacteriota bacterium]
MDRILIVDDEKGMRDLLSIMLKNEGYKVDAAESATRARDLISRGTYDLVISDIAMPDGSGVDVLRTAREIQPDCIVILITAYASTESAIEALKLGAYDYIIKPFDVEELRIVLKNALEKRQLERENTLLKRELKETSRFDDLVGESSAMEQVKALLDRVAPTNSTVLIWGESGTGKELAARAIHGRSPRRAKQFVSINCGALPDELLESELFGHVKGSFTGAVATKKGLFEVADGGTIFLDEIGDTSAAMQIKLLRVLQERQIRRVGGTEQLEVDVRIITATNQDLETMVREKRFREDLYYRINVIAVQMPPLREKREDIPFLANHFLAKYNKIMGKKIREISPEAMRHLTEYGWPGNVRELENVIERAVALEGTERILPASFNREVASRADSGQGLPVVLTDGGIDLETQLEQLRERLMSEALARTHGVQTRAAELLGMSFRSFRYFAKKYNLMEGREPKEGFGQ